MRALGGCAGGFLHAPHVVEQLAPVGGGRLRFARCRRLCAQQRTHPLEPRLAVATDGEREQGRYGTLLRLAASARAAGDQAAAVSL